MSDEKTRLDLRKSLERCEFIWPSGEREPGRIEIPNTHALCALWTVRAAELDWVGPIPREEADDIDANIDIRRVARVRERRAALIQHLREAVARDPRDAWSVGQLVRFAVDQRDERSATDAVAACRADHWWCESLAGYVAYWGGKTATADSLFRRAVAAAPDSVRCAWTDLSILLAAEERATYRATPCGAARDSLNDRLWWLSDPLLREPGNERRAEHFFRHVMITLRSGVPEEGERWSWATEEGGDGIREMLVRYGWPTGSVWHKDLPDATRRGGLRTVFDTWSPGRIHSVPSLALVLASTPVNDTTWDLYQPRIRGQAPWMPLPAGTDLERAFTKRPSQFALLVDCVPGSTGHACRQVTSELRTWPAEHFRRRTGPLETMWYQHGVFRRDTTALFVMATEVAPLTGWRSRTPAAAGMASVAVSAHPDSAEVSSQTLSERGPFVVQRAVLPRRQQLIDVDVTPTGTAPITSRARAWFVSPPALSDASNSGLDVSPLLFVKPLSADDNRVLSPIARALPSTKTSGAKLGLYWEVYGVAEQDSLEMAVVITPPKGAAPGLLARLLRRSAETDGSVRISWIERAGVESTRLPTRTPAFQREMTLDIGNLDAGDYRIAVTVARSGKVATASRVLTVIPQT